MDKIKQILKSFGTPKEIKGSDAFLIVDLTSKFTLEAIDSTNQLLENAGKKGRLSYLKAKPGFNSYTGKPNTPVIYIGLPKVDKPMDDTKLDSKLI